MSAAFTHARCVGAGRAACASTGNTSASLALYCSVTRLMKAVISSARARSPMENSPRPGLRRADGADRRRLRRRHGPRQGSSQELGIYLVNSVNPSAWKGRRRSCTACWKPSPGSRPTGSWSPAETWATPALRQGLMELAALGIDRPGCRGWP